MSFRKYVTALTEGVEYNQDEIKELGAEAQKEADEFYEKFIKDFDKVLKGFTRGKSEWNEDQWIRGKFGDNDYLNIRLDKIIAGVYPSGEFHYALIGEVSYGFMGKAYRFGRRGIDNGISEFEDSLKDLPSPKALFNKIEKKVKEGQSRIKDSIEIQIIGQTFVVHSKNLLKYQADLKKKKSIMLHPAGMGTGYNISTKPFKGKYDCGVLDTSISKLFGFEKLYYQAFDAD